jgi:glycosyltransferase involved in cell wall biosynthesis
VGAIPDYLIDNYNGYLLQSLEPDYFYKRLREAIEDVDDRRAIAENGKETAKQLSWSSIADQYLKLISTISRN